MAARADANSSIVVDIVSDQRGVNYFVNGQQMTAAKLKEFIGLAVKAGPNDPIWVRLDLRTPFETVFKTLQQLKEFGADRIEVMAGSDPAVGAANNLWLSIRGENLKSDPIIPPIDQK